jgi:hypothetical protein
MTDRQPTAPSLADALKDSLLAAKRQRQERDDALRAEGAAAECERCLRIVLAQLAAGHPTVAHAVNAITDALRQDGDTDD